MQGPNSGPFYAKGKVAVTVHFRVFRVGRSFGLQREQNRVRSGQAEPESSKFNVAFIGS